MNVSNIGAAPGIGPTQQVDHRLVTLANERYLPGSFIIAGADARDPLNSVNVKEIRAGLLLGRITSGKKFGASLIGVLSVAYDASADMTSMTLSAADAAELVRRQGSSGTFKLTGPPSAAGVVQTATVTYSAVNTTTGVVTITALSVDVDEVQTINITGTLTAGSFTLEFVDSAGAIKVTDPIAYNANTAAIQAGVDTALGGSKVTVGGTAITAMTFTFDGTGYAATAQTLIKVDTSGLTGEEDATITRTTAAVVASGAGSNDFVVGSFVQPTDGSEAPVTLLPNGFPIRVVDINDNDRDVELPNYLTGALVDSSQILNWPSDTSLRQWIVDALNAVGSFTFDHKHGL